jgi:hypothetical protein
VPYQNQVKGTLGIIQRNRLGLLSILVQIDKFFGDHAVKNIVVPFRGQSTFEQLGNDLVEDCNIGGICWYNVGGQESGNALVDDVQKGQPIVIKISAFDEEFQAWFCIKSNHIALMSYQIKNIVRCFDTFALQFPDQLRVVFDQMPNKCSDRSVPLCHFFQSVDVVVIGRGCEILEERTLDHAQDDDAEDDTRHQEQNAIDFVRSRLDWNTHQVRKYVPRDRTQTTRGSHVVPENVADEASQDYADPRFWLETIEDEFPSRDFGSFWYHHADGFCGVRYGKLYLVEEKKTQGVVHWR